jgi:hypothetical protein
LIGEAPHAEAGRLDPSRLYAVTVESKVRWTDNPSSPVDILCTECRSQGYIVPDNEDPPVPDLDIRRDGTLSGNLPATIKWDNNVYLKTDKEESLHALAFRLAGWETSYMFESDTMRKPQLLESVVKLLREENPLLPAIVHAGTVVRFRPDIGRVAESRVPKSRLMRPGASDSQVKQD